MSEQSNKTLVYGLIAVAVLLAAVVGILVYQQSQKLPAPTATATPTGQTPTGQNGAPAGGAAAPATPFDPKSATKVPKGTEPEAFVQAYYEACQKGDWQAAYDALPAETKAGTNPDSLKQQVSGYGVKDFKVTGAKVNGDQAAVTVDQVTAQYGTFENTWTFTKKDGVWYVAGKSVTGMK